jgi:site-specific DNA-methyltransferase (adenine-specific)
MEPWHHDDRATVYHGDCLEVLAELPDASVDAVVTDPPYGLGFMGKEWDGPGGMLGQMATGHEKRGALAYGGTHSRGYADNDNAAFQAWAELWAVECLRVLKPGGHLLAFGGTRTWHRLACAIEDAGFEVRDSIAWMYGSGFPKSLDVSKAIDKVNGEANRLHKFTAWMRTTGLTARQINEATGTFMGSHYLTAKSQPAIPTPDLWAILRPLCGDVPAWVDELVDRIAAEREVIETRKDNGGRSVAYLAANKNQGHEYDITAPATDAAREWSGWGTALKPAHEPIVVARKPLVGTVAANVLEHGTGALNIDACRIGTTVETWPSSRRYGGGPTPISARGYDGGETVETGPAPAGRWPANVVLDEDQAAELDRQSGNRPSAGEYTKSLEKPERPWAPFAEMPKTGTSPRSNKYANEQGGAARFFYVAKAPARERPKVDGTAHPTVKPLTLMRWLCRLVTPPDGVILEPFAGSGTTIEAALLEGFRVVGIEREADYLPLIQARLDRVAAQEPEDEQLTLDASA